MGALPEKFNTKPREGKLFGAGASLVGGTAPPMDVDFRFQGGTFVATTNGSGDVTLVFPRPFLNGVLTVIVIQGDTTSPLANPVTTAYTLTQCTIRVFNSSTGAPLGGNLMRFNYYVIGW